jgi:nitrile hydratase accessory protein
LNPPEAPFEEPWQAQAFALAVALNARGVFTWSEWSETLGAAIARNPDAPYYESWLETLVALLRRKELTDASELAERKLAWERAYLATPHGQPVGLPQPGVRRGPLAPC